MSLIKINIIEELPTGNNTGRDIMMKPTQTVGTLKRNIVAKYKELKVRYPPSKQKLYHNGNKLGDSRTVDVIGDKGTVYLRHEDVIEVFYCSPDKSTLKIKTLVDKVETIAQVKTRLVQAKGLDPTKYYVTYSADGRAAAKTLNPETLTIGASGIQEFGILHFIAGVDGG